MRSPLVTCDSTDLASSAWGISKKCSAPPTFRNRVCFKMVQDGPRRPQKAKNAWKKGKNDFVVMEASSLKRNPRYMC